MSLAVLGLIAGLTVPSVVQAVERGKNRSLLKEAFQTISAITQAGVLNGDFSSITDWDVVNSTSPTGIVGYISSKLNYSKQCLRTDTTSEGCRRGYPGTPANHAEYNVHNARWILPNGVKLQAHSSSSGYTFSPTNMLWTVTAKAYANDMVGLGTTNPDTVMINCNVTDTTITMHGITHKPGICGGYATGWDQQLSMVLGNT